ncbi:MAG: DUF2752 domain-containing protein [Bacteroidota bacterium]|nr:DUF2752 domain-containing protein [Bacteroidota bacterium]
MSRFTDNTKMRLITLIVAGILVFFLYFSGDLISGLHIPCVHYQLTGIRCPLCGFTRAANAFFHFHFLEALFYNPAVFLLVIFVIAEVVDILYASHRTKYFRRLTLIALASGVVLIYIFRIIEHFYCS